MASAPSRTLSGLLLNVAGAVIPGIGRVRAQKEPFARAWRAANTEALRGDKPIWVALGDSMTQGIGARDISGGWVGQLQSRLGGTDDHLNVVNLSATGARIRDVLTDQLPELRRLSVTPRLVTVLVGANDMLTAKRRRHALAAFTELLGALPSTDTVVATLPQDNTPARAINALVDDAAAKRRIRVADMRGGALGPVRGSLAEDYFHPNERGYSIIADIFETPVRGCLARTPRT